MKSKCCKADLVMDVRGIGLFNLWPVGTKYICRECKREYSPQNA